MNSLFNQPALLKNLAGAHLPPVALNVSAELQFCVDAGACAATCFFDDMTSVGLHDHISVSMQGFLLSLESAIVSQPSTTGQWLSERRQHCIDAFGAGYLGRIQQELRLIHPLQTKRPVVVGGDYSGLFN